MTPKEKAEDLVNQFKNILMDEDTDCGNEILCTLIAIKNALILTYEVGRRVPYQKKSSSNLIKDDLTVEYWAEVMKKLREM
jgi:hypothetical protein